MPESNQKLKRFTTAIREKAAVESQEAMSALEAELRSKLEEVGKQAEIEADAFFKGEFSHLQAEAGKQVSRQKQEGRESLFLRRNEIAASVFEEVCEKIVAYTNSDAYATRLEELLQEALPQFHNATYLRILLRKRDQVHQSLLQKQAQNLEITFLDGSFQLGGLIVEAPELGLRVDSTFDSRLQELRGRFAELFHISLTEVDEEVAQ